MFGKIIATHDLCDTIRPGQHERSGDLVRSRLEEGQYLAAAAMATLIVVVVDEDQRLVAVNEAPRVAERPQVLHLIAVVFQHHRAQTQTIFELGDAPQVSIVRVPYWLTASQIDHFLVDERFFVVAKYALKLLKMFYQSMSLVHDFIFSLNKKELTQSEHS